MMILSIETSCDDTSLAIIRTRGKNRVYFDILSNIISSQIKIHKKWGGVYPVLAMRAHQKNLIPILKKVMKIANCTLRQTQGDTSATLSIECQNKKINTINKILEKEPELLNSFLKFVPKIKKPKIDVISVTEGPGLEPCLWTGINLAKALSFFWKIPLVPVNHVRGHIFANFIEEKINLKTNSDFFPALALVVSGGHTQLILMNDTEDYKILGETRDDAAVECLDNVARILGLEYPGGPIIEKKAEEWKIANDTLRQAQGDTERSRSVELQIDLPRPMINSKNYDFSFSGLKTAVLYDFKIRSSKIKKDKNYIRQLCFETQQAIFDVLIKKTIKAAKDFRVKSVLLGGGVASNQELRKQIKKAVENSLPKTKLLIPEPVYCTDNAVMTAIQGYFNFSEKKSKHWKNLKARANLRTD
ncbi:MAG: tRNA (adenosine(37)-N6)-threonylcarbamoyltransferase complex transferase subunit TsaD [Candidatus Nealsonbacteria bacterium]|nr:tRNA (adenosine(37)-N6)-threonylcarbamoyltransferase complex transferase subunit TsaD [Candidatus Nealsonbacteria bacterium]